MELNKYQIAFNATRSVYRDLLEIDEKLLRDYPDSERLKVRIEAQKDFINTMNSIEKHLVEKEE